MVRHLSASHVANIVYLDNTYCIGGQHHGKSYKNDFFGHVMPVLDPNDTAGIINTNIAFFSSRYLK